MFGSAIIEVAIGLVVVYVLFSLVSSTVTETIAQLLSLRGKNLVQGIERLLDNSNQSALKQAFFNHPLIKGLDHSFSKKPKQVRPEYISHRTFTTVINDILDLPEKTAAAGGNIREGLEKLPDGDLKVSLLAIFNTAQDDLKSFEERISKWYDESMNRVSALYKRKAHVIGFLTAMVLVVGFNVDSLYFGDYLYRNSNVRQALLAVGEEAVSGELKALNQRAAAANAGQAETAENAAGEATPAAGVEAIDVNTMLTAVMESNLPLGWSQERWKMAWANPWAKLLGLLISVFAVSLGAPFWFQILNKLVNLKSSGMSPPTIHEERNQQPAAS